MGHPIKRFAYQFDQFDEFERTSDLLKRLVELAETLDLPYVCRPLELAKTAHGTLCVLTDKYEHRLADLMTERGLKGGSERAWKVFGKILEGVAALHKRNICHGDLRLDTIFF